MQHWLEIGLSGFLVALISGVVAWYSRWTRKTREVPASSPMPNQTAHSTTAAVLQTGAVSGAIAFGDGNTQTISIEHHDHHYSSLQPSRAPKWQEHPTPIEIRRQLKEIRAPYQREQAANTFAGLQVIWRLQFHSRSTQDPGKTDMCAFFESDAANQLLQEMVFAVVDHGHAARLKSLHQDSQVLVRGEISKVTTTGITLKRNPEIEIEEIQGHP